MFISGASYFNSRAFITVSEQRGATSQTVNGSVGNESKGLALLSQSSALAELATAAYVERYQISIEGKSVAPEDRIRLEGVPQEYVEQMSDAEYLGALNRQDLEYGAKSSNLAMQGMALANPTQASVYLSNSKPNFTADAAKSTLKQYVDGIAQAIKTQNVEHAYQTSSSVREYLLARGGDKELQDGISISKFFADAQEKLIQHGLDSLNTAYTFDGAALASKKDGVWSFNEITGSYSNNGITYRFSIGENGLIKDL